MVGLGFCHGIRDFLEGAVAEGEVFGAVGECFVLPRFHAQQSVQLGLKSPLTKPALGVADGKELGDVSEDEAHPQVIGDGKRGHTRPQNDGVGEDFSVMQGEADRGDENTHRDDDVHKNRAPAFLCLGHKNYLSVWTSSTTHSIWLVWCMRQYQINK